MDDCYAYTLLFWKLEYSQHVYTDFSTQDYNLCTTNLLQRSRGGEGSVLMV